MNLVDLGIVLVIGLGILIGWRNGLIGPLLAEATFLLTFWIISTHPGLIAMVHPFPLSQLGQYARVIDYYERTLRPQLASSQLAPVVFRFGARIPLIGRTVPNVAP